MRDAWPGLIDTGALARWMDARQLGAGPIEKLTPLTGGTQNILLRFTRGGCDFVLRRPSEFPRAEANDTMRREARVLAALANSNVPHPRLLAACGETDVLGVAFYLMEPVDGFNAGNGIPPTHRRADIQHAMGMALIDAALALGAVDHVAVGLADFGRPDNYLQRQVQRWATQLEGYRQLSGWPGAHALPPVDRIARWLQAHCPAHFTPGILHGDFHIGNVMFRPDAPALAAVVDWELATIGDPLIDLGWLLATWPGDDVPVPDLAVQPWLGFPTAQELAARYRAGSSRDLSALDWYVVMACYKLGIILEGSYARACAGRTDAETGDKLHCSAIGLLERAARLIR